jgi:hypothetical protein
MSTEYEKERQKNIERNKSLLASLGINSKLTASFNGQKTPNNRPKRKAKSEDIVTIKRESRRLAAKDRPSYNYDELQKQQQKMAKIIAKEEQKVKKDQKRRQSDLYTNMWKSPSRRWNKEESASEGETSSDEDGEDDWETSKRKSSRLKKKKRIDYSIFEKNLNISFKTQQQTSDTVQDIFSVKASEYPEPVVMFTGIPASHLYYSVCISQKFLTCLDRKQIGRHYRRKRRNMCNTFDHSSTISTYNQNNMRD